MVKSFNCIVIICKVIFAPLSLYLKFWLKCFVLNTYTRKSSRSKDFCNLLNLHLQVKEKFSQTCVGLVILNPELLGKIPFRCS